MPEQRRPHVENLVRTVPMTLQRSEGDPTDGLTIDGYGAVFNSVTEIDSWEGTFEEEILPGAFKKSLRERTPKMQFDHGQHPLLGSLPLGRWEVAEEDARGLHVVGRFTDNWLTAPFRDAIADGGVDGMSFRFAVVRDQWFDGAGTKLKDGELDDMLWRGAGDRGPLRRKLMEVKVSEVGPVMWPAYADTSVGVRNLDGRRTVVIDLARLTAGNPAEQARLAKLIAIADRASVDSSAPAEGQVCETCGKDGHLVCFDEDAPQTPDPASGASTEPRSTEAPADEHPPNANGAPPVTESSAGEHSSASTPANPVERAAAIKARYRQVTDRVLALTPSSTTKESAR